jgi:hypothetical protein
MQINESHRVPGISLNIRLLGVASEPLRLHPPRGSDGRLQPQSRYVRTQIRCQAGDHPRPLALIQVAKNDFEFEFICNAIAVTIVREILDPYPSPRSWTSFRGQDTAQSIDDVALASIVFTDEYRQRAAHFECPIKIAVADCSQRTHIHAVFQARGISAKSMREIVAPWLLTRNHATPRSRLSRQRGHARLAFVIEAQVQIVFVKYLNELGWEVTTDNADHTDVVARRGSELLIAEVKGTTSSPGLDVDTAYGQLLRRMQDDHPLGARYALVVPDSARKFAVRVSEHVRKRVGIEVWAVDEAGAVQSV